MADIKISQLTAKGTAIASTDLIEISESDGAGGYVTKSVTGANIIGSKQDTLVSGTNIKTLNSNSILGSGDLAVQPTLISGTNIKTIEGQSILGGGNINITNNDVGLGNVDDTSDLNKPISTATQTALNAKQNTITNSDSITQGATNLFLTTAERTKLTNTSGTNTGDQTNITGNAATVTTNANLTGVVTSTGNATTIADNALSIAKTSGLQGAIDLKQDLSSKNAANGYAGLDASSKINPSQLPSIAITDTFVVINQAAQLALTAEVGDVAVRTDLNKSFILKTSPATTFANWQELLTPTDSVSSIFGRTGVVTAQNGDYTASQVGAPSGSGTSTGTNTGDNATNSQYSGLVSNATHTGDATGNVGLTVKGINGTILSTLGTGILKNTTGTGVPSIAVAADFPILNQNTTGTAGSTATLATARTISMNGDVAYTSPAFDGSANVLGTATLASIGVAGTYTKVTTDAKGRVTVGANLTAGDVPTLNQNTTGTAANVTGIVALANGGTGTATPSLVAGTNVTITGTFPNQTINSSGGAAGVTAVTATTPVVATGTTTPVISLATNYGDTQNPYSSKTANHILAAPNGTAGVPTFRAIVGADIPTLNQNTTGTSATVTSAAQPTITSVGTLTGLTVTNPIVGSVTGSSGSTTGNAATVTTNANLTGDITSIGNATSIAAGVIVNADISATAGITDNKLADIDSVGKVKNSATTATASNTASTIVLRDASNNFSAGTITANLTGTASGNLVSGGALGTPSSGSLLNTTGYLSSNLSGIVPVAKGGTGTATPSLVAGTNITITGSFPNQTITAAGGGGGGGVTQIVAGTNVTISPAGGTGVVTVNASGGGGGTAGGPHLITQPLANATYGLKTNSAPNTTCTTGTNRMTLMPFVPNNDFVPTGGNVQILTFILNVTIGANVNCKIVIFSDSLGMPLTKLYEGPTMSCQTTGLKFDFSSFGGFSKGTKYWIGTITSGTGASLTQYNPNSMIPVSDAAGGATNWFLSTVNYAYASVPATVNGYIFLANATDNCPAVYLSIINNDGG